MSDENQIERGTRKLEPSDNPIPKPNESTEPLEYQVPWVIELRIVGTPAVLQVRIQDELIIGRTDANFDATPDIDLEPYEGYQQGVSRRHAALYAKNNRLVIRDLGSSNGTYINGRALLKDQEYRVRHNDTLIIGKLQLQVFFAVMPSNVEDPKTQPRRVTIPNIGNGQHIVVVDQDVNIANVIGSVLTQSGFRVTLLSTFSEAINLFDQAPPDAIVTELILPDVSGLDLLRYIRDHPKGKTIPLLVITSATGGFQMGQAIDAGADEFMCKPISIDELMSNISQITYQMGR